MKLAELLFERVSQAQMIGVEKFCDALWSKLGIDVTFTKHFLDRVNDERNGKEISAAELIRLFKKEYEQNGKNVAKMSGEAEAVFRDLVTMVNLPFVVKSHGEEKTILAKTVLRKKDFRTEDPELSVK